MTIKTTAWSQDSETEEGRKSKTAASLYTGPISEADGSTPPEFPRFAKRPSLGGKAQVVAIGVAAVLLLCFSLTVAFVAGKWLTGDGDDIALVNDDSFFNDETNSDGTEHGEDDEDFPADEEQVDEDPSEVDAVSPRPRDLSSEPSQDETNRNESNSNHARPNKAPSRVCLLKSGAWIR